MKKSTERNDSLSNPKLLLDELKSLVEPSEKVVELRRYSNSIKSECHHSSQSKAKNKQKARYQTILNTDDE